MKGLDAIQLEGHLTPRAAAAKRHPSTLAAGHAARGRNLGGRDGEPLPVLGREERWQGRGPLPSEG